MLQQLMSDTDNRISELTDALSNKDKDALWQDVHSMGYDTWASYYSARVVDGQVFEFVSVGAYSDAPDPRWRDQVTRRRMILASIYFLQCGRTLLSATTKAIGYMDSPDPMPGVHWQPAALGRIFFDAAYVMRPNDWPFEGPSPFDDEG